MTITTSQTIDGKTITAYLGVVSAAQILAMPGGAKAIQRGWQTSVDGTLETMTQQAEALGADAIIAARFEPSGSYVCATGTAVKLG